MNDKYNEIVDNAYSKDEFQSSNHYEIKFKPSKTETIQFRCTEEQRKNIKESAEGLGLSISSYIIYLITKDNETFK